MLLEVSIFPAGCCCRTKAGGGRETGTRQSRGESLPPTSAPDCLWHWALDWKQQWQRRCRLPSKHGQQCNSRQYFIKANFMSNRGRQERERTINRFQLQQLDWKIFFFKVALVQQAYCLLCHGSEEVKGDKGLIIYCRWTLGSAALIES